MRRVGRSLVGFDHRIYIYWIFVHIEYTILIIWNRLILWKCHDVCSCGSKSSVRKSPTRKSILYQFMFTTLMQIRNYCFKLFCCFCCNISSFISSSFNGSSKTRHHSDSWFQSRTKYVYILPFQGLQCVPVNLWTLSPVFNSLFLW